MGHAIVTAPAGAVSVYRPSNMSQTQIVTLATLASGFWAWPSSTSTLNKGMVRQKPGGYSVVHLRWISLATKQSCGLQHLPNRNYNCTALSMCIGPKSCTMAHSEHC